jgi:hypothetical protein
MKIILRFPQGLAEFVRCFAFARHLHLKKHEVLIECRPHERSLLNLIDYAAWKDPADTATTAEATYDLSVFPLKTYKYRNENPAKKWFDFLCAEHGEVFRGARREIVFTSIPSLDEVRAKYSLPEQFSVACPIGWAAAIPIDFALFENWLIGSVKPRGSLYYLMPQGFTPNRRFICCDNLADIATLVHGSQDFATINAGPAAFACAKVGSAPVRNSWHHVSPINAREREQDDIAHAGQIRWEVQINLHNQAIVRQPR